MQLSLLITLAYFVIYFDLVDGFLAQTRCSRSFSTRLQLKTSVYVEEPSRLTSLPGDEAIFILSMISDDDLRRKTVNSYLLDGLAREQMMLTPGSSWDRYDSFFVQKSNKYLRLIGTAVQDEAWEKYITTGCERLPYKPQQLWACVDMTVQFSRVIGNFEKEYRKEAKHAFQ